MTLTAIRPEEAECMIAVGAALIDIRSPDEHVRERIPGAANLPLPQIDRLGRHVGPIVFHCRSGLRTEANMVRLAAAGKDSPCFILAGGIEAWRSSGRPTIVDRRQPIEIMRQVQLIAGGLVLLGVMLGFLMSDLFFGLSGLIGAGLMTAGATGWCGMATILRRLPWNRPVMPD